MSASVKKRTNWFKVFFIGFILLVLIVALKVFGPATGNLSNGEYFYLHTGWNYDKTVSELKEEHFLSSTLTFNILAKMINLPEHIHPGKYRIKDGMSCFEIVRMLRSGKQIPVKLVINKLRTIKDLVTLMSQNLEADSASLWEQFHDATYLEAFGLDTNILMCAILPDTYEFYWNTNADKAFRKIEKNYRRYWNDQRKLKAKQLGYSEKRVIIIASIVDEETNRNEDKPNIASVYLNRLNKGMKLQADPTVKFAIGDFMIKRITGEMLSFQSPYNTYLNEGMPPGPICTPSPSSIEAVLEAPKTTYLYFCAKDDLSGYSVFATTYEEHQKNAKKYQQALNRQGIH